MRKIWILAILVIFLFSLSISAFAASDTYYLHDLDLKVSIPSDYTVITRGTPENSSAFSQLGMTKSELMAYFEANNVYLNAITDMYREEIVVVMSEIDMSNLTLYTDSELQEMVKSWEDLYHTVGLIISKYDFYQCGQAKFIKLYFEDTAQTVHGLQYCTVYNGKAIHFTMRSYEGGLSSRQETAIKTVVDSVQFNDVPSGTVSGEDAELFVYTDQESGVSFAVPENWEQIAFTEDPGVS